MKNRFYIIAATALAFIATSCKDEFLEEEPNRRLSPEQIAAAAETDPSLLNGNIAGLYATMYNAETGGTTNHDDFGQKGYDIFSDMLVSDMALRGTNYGWYTGVVRYQATKDFTTNAGYQPWRYYYRIIFGANTVIDLLGGNDAVPTTPEARAIMGQAKAMRAYAYFYLVNFYSPTGYGTGTEKILPIYKDAKSPNQPKSTSDEVFSLMVSDLTQAIDYLQNFSRTSKDQINQQVARGLLAYVLAARGTNADLAQVVTLTDAVIATAPNATNGRTGGFKLMESTEMTTTGFNNVAHPSWMWGVDITLANGLDLISWWGQIDLFTYSYAWAGDPKVIDRSLYDAIKPTDARKAWFNVSTNNRNLMPINKFYAPARTIGGQRNIETDYVYMRFEEMYLLNAEAKARLGQDGPAKTMLKQLLQKRMADVLYVDALGGQALLDEIYLQTRIELWGEGKAYLAMKRLRKPVTRGANHLFEAGKTFAFDSDELTFNIPQQEEINNPVLNQ